MDKDRLIPTNIEEIMKESYIDYSMSVIISRALPDVRDGLKPVHRRILYAMRKEGLFSNRSFDKCAGVVGEVLKNFHPHGDGSVYDALVRMAQSWVMRYPLIEPQGNFGSIDGDSAAAYRYTECRLRSVAEEMLRDIDENTVDFMPNYKESLQEPTVLPCAVPGLLMNGSTGIAVGMTTNIPPHNLGELVDALGLLMENPDVSLEDLMACIPGPDFPTGGSIIGLAGIRKYMQTGRGIVRVRGTAMVEETESGKEQIVITEIPYAVNRSSLVTQIAELVTSKVFEEVSDLRDESDENTRIVIELKRGAIARVLINKLYKQTLLENSFGVILLAIHRNRPKEMNIKEMLHCYLEHRREVVTRRTAFRLKKALDRLHILEGYRIALDNLDDFVHIIRSSKDKEEARERLRAKYPLSELQANAILELRLYQITGLERGKIEAEYAALEIQVAEYEAILGSEKRLLEVIKEELLVIRNAYANPRKTRILPEEGAFRMEDVVPNEGCMITVSHKGFIKRTDVSAYRSQRRGGKGVIGTGSYDDDFTEHLFTASTHDYILFVMNTGRVYVERVYTVPEGSRTAKGRVLANFLSLGADEKVAAMICTKEFGTSLFLVLCTKHGIVKKTTLEEYAHQRRGGVIGIRLDDDDNVVAARLTTGEDDLVLITHNAMSIRFCEDELRDQGRATRGVKGVTLKPGDFVQAMEVVDPTATLLIAGADGMGKRSNFDEYPIQSRAGVGVIAIRAPKGVCGALRVYDDSEIMLLTHSGQAVRSPIKDIRVIGRTTRGVRLINLESGDTLIGVSPVVEVEPPDA